MSEWDDQMLADVVAKKSIGKPHNPSAGICKHFLQAVEERKYGWFWECPNGDKCQYRHALPSGFVLKRDQKKEEKIVERPIEDIIEEERQALPDGGTPMSEVNFKKWKEKRTTAREKEQKKQKASQFSGRKTGKQLLEEDADRYKDEEGEGEGDAEVDVMMLLKQKHAEEDQMDRDNAALVEIMQLEMADLEKEGEKRVEAEVAEIEAQRKAEKLKEQADASSTTVTSTVSTTTTTTATITTASPEQAATVTTTATQSQLEGVDTSLFAAEEAEDLPDFDEGDQ